MALESSLRELSDGLRSSRVTDRKKNAENLKEFLTRNAVPSLLSENTVRKKGYTWNNLFEDINELVLKETEKYETSKTYESVTGPMCTSLLHLCVAGSNKGKAYIRVDKITDACLLILRDSRFRKAIGDAYLNLLYKHVLPTEYYLGFIAPTTWEELLDVCLSACLSKSSKLDNFTRLRLVLLIMRSAKNYCQFVTPLRESLIKLKKCFEKVAYDKKSQEVTIEITILLLETLSAECPLAMCRFIESVLGLTLKFYDQNMDHKKKCMLFQLLHHSVVLHHPQGRSRAQEGSIAEDWDAWNKLMNSFLEIVCLEAAHMQKIRKPSDDILKLSEHFCDMAAVVYFQVFSIAESSENIEESSSKRLKSSCNKNKTFNDVIEELRQNHLPWLGITLMYVKNNSSVISTDDYISLTKVVQGLVTHNANVDWDIVEALTCLVLENVTSRESCRKEYCDKNLLALWSSCVRSSITPNGAHKAVHKIIQVLLNLDVVNYQNAQALFKFYIDKGMPVTDHSVNTLITLFHKFFSKYSYDDIRSKCFLWLVNGDLISVDATLTKNLISRLISNDNINMKKINADIGRNDLYDTLFNSNEKCILFSALLMQIKQPTTNKSDTQESFELNTEIERLMHNYFKEKIADCLEQYEKKNLSLREFVKFTHIAVIYIDITLKCNTVYSDDEIKATEMYRLLKKSLSEMYISLEAVLKSDSQISIKIELLKLLKSMLLSDLGMFMANEVRSSVHKEFFMCMNRILITEVKADDEELVYAGDEREMDSTTLKHNCVLVLAAYCRKKVNYRGELLNFILDPKIYDFKTDAHCVFQCLELLNDPKLEETPSELLFTLMQFMCRDLYRDPKASYHILNHLIKMLDVIWSSQSTMKQNCLIMIKSYVQRSEKLHYPPYVAGLVYECVAKIAMLDRKHNYSNDNTFENALMRKIKGDVHSLRLYCCYMLKFFVGEYTEDEADFFLADLLEIFVINVTEGQAHCVKDEFANRTSTVLHCFMAFAETKPPLTQKIITSILQIQKDKSLEKNLVKKVLRKIVSMAGKADFDDYIDKNIVSILYSWLLKDNNLNDFQSDLLGFESLEMFLEKHKRWLMTTEILWQKGGDIKSSDMNQTAASIIETCFCNIIMLCLPYVAIEKYHINFIGIEHPNTHKRSMASAKKMFNLSGQILQNEKWTNLFVENVGELVRLTATHLCDRDEAKTVFGVKLPEQTHSYYYPRNVFTAILDYIGDLTDGNIMLYLCENQPLAVFQVLFTLWKTVLEENVFELKVLALHAFITFLDFVPFGTDADSFVCNFTCKSFAHGINNCKTSKEITVFLKGAEVVLKRLLPDRADLIRKSVSELLTVLVIKKEEGFGKECKTLFDYLVVDMKHYLKDSEDVVDFVSSITPGTIANVDCSTWTVFLAKLKSHQLSLNSPSPDMLSNLHQFLSSNKHYVKTLYQRMSEKGFSEDCGSSYVHQIVHSLNNILKSTHYDDKITIEACNCLSEIGTYDLKTLVTVPPIDTRKIVDLSPNQYIACRVVKSLSDLMFDENPEVTRKVADTLNELLKYREGSDALDLEQVDNEVLKPLASNNDTACVFKMNSRAFDKYCFEHNDGIFINAMTAKWNPNNSTNHCDWLKCVTTTLLKTIDPDMNYFVSLLKVCLAKSSICQKLLPALFGLILRCSSEKYVDALSKQINNFFTFIWDQTFTSQCDAEESQTNIRINSTMDIGQKMVVLYMLDLVDFIRLQRGYYKQRTNRTVDTLNYLRLQYNKVAWAAAVADQNLAAIYYGELWAVSKNDGVPPSSPEATSLIPGGTNIQQIFRKCYVSIGEMDAIDGCGTAHLTNESETRKHLINTGQFTDALLLHDIALSCGGQFDLDLQCGAVRSLHKSGMHHLALQYIKSLPEDDELNDIKYECLSFLGDWNEIVDTRDLEEKSREPNCNPHSIVKAFHYACLKECLNIQITPDVDNKLQLPLNRAKLAVSRLCLNLNMENCQNVYKVVGKLHLFTDIEDYFSVRTNRLRTDDLLSKWEVDKLPAFNDFKHMESLISQRVLILDHAAKSTTNMQDNIVDLQIQYARLGLSNNRIQMAQRLLSVVKKIRSSEEISLADSEISWAKGHKEIALSLLRNNIVSSQPENVQLTARSLRQYALWMVESKRDNARDIIDKYLLKSLQVLNKCDNVETRLKVYHNIAKFADAEYKQVVTYMNSAIFENKVKLMENLKGTATNLSLKSTQQSLTKEERKAYFTNDRFKALDEVEIASTRSEKENFLRLAMKYYLLSLKQCEENNLSIFRVISLWLENPFFEFDESEQCRFEDLLHAIPSRKFITVIPQLAPRLSNEETPFAENLRKILKRCATEHPHHTLPILFALKNSDKDRVILNASAVGGSTQRSRSQEPRTIAAEALVNELARNKELNTVIEQMEKICDATISFANYKPKKKDNRQDIPAAEPLRRLNNLNAIPIPTVNIPVRQDCKYSNFPTLISFENYFELVGGINCPKKVACKDSSGHKRILLIKGEDDMRQDAVMQQVFAIVNTLLEKNPVTSRNKLLIRTYKVVPMSKQSGVLEWCEGTIPLGAYLVGGGVGNNDGAHARYRPQDISCSVARKKLTEYHEARKSTKEKLLVFNRILKEFRPVFHFFFTEHYLDPVTWYERRLAYTKSVATSSMVGYIMGLGDRHVQNILIDKRTAEVIHIDFGIAFDQGKTLHTPETVPFRLTQDMIAGFGSSGVEGMFRRCCEKTMQLLRDNSETLLTILEVLLCDPLYSWTVTSGQQDAPNRNTSVLGITGSNSCLAERALLAVSSKLGGTEGGLAGGVAVPGQIARLLQCATDNTNLCRLFPGWQPYL